MLLGTMSVPRVDVTIPLACARGRPQGGHAILKGFCRSASRFVLVRSRKADPNVPVTSRRRLRMYARRSHRHDGFAGGIRHNVDV